MSRRIHVDSDVWRTMGELLDVDARPCAMHDMGVDTQVVYPTFFNGAAGSSMAETALARGYSRWMADRCGEDSLPMGSDFAHHDHATELDFVGALQARVDSGELSASFVRKLTYDNPRTFLRTLIQERGRTL
jgi:hypothetical protein